MSYAFSFDASACTGCKACQVACKDKNNLPAGLLWRRVVEVSGGEWNKPAAHGRMISLPITCHWPVITAPTQMRRRCPVDAHRPRDGIVLIDGRRCMG
jgi:anaerobic dimethyl sulfoxide reductase subunit B (iron-sulfur subunit)